MHVLFISSTTRHNNKMLMVLLSDVMSDHIRELKEDISFEIPNKDKGTITNPSNSIRIQKHLGIVLCSKQGTGRILPLGWNWNKVVKEDFE
jgi:hypothetical protein